MMNNKAIVVYVDDNERNIEEYSWLYKSWNINHLYLEYDLVVYCNPRTVSRLEVHKNILIREMKPVHETEQFWKDYKFVNSFAMFNSESEVEWIKSRYDYVLKSDCDVFLTKNMMGLNPDKVMIGIGAYALACFDDVYENLNRVRKNLNFKNEGINHVGASIFAKTDTVVNVVKNHFIVTKYLIEEEFNDYMGEWPCWYGPVASMYAIDLVVNNLLSAAIINAWCLDAQCMSNRIDASTYHIHAWHTASDFSKGKWFNGEYAILKSSTVPNIAKDYCLWIASNTLKELKRVVD